MEPEALNEAMIHTSACDVLGVAYPIVQAGMARSNTGAALVAAVSAAGGLGVLGCLDRPPLRGQLRAAPAGRGDLRRLPSRARPCLLLLPWRPGGRGGPCARSRRR